MTEPFRVHVRPLGNGFLAENEPLAISVGGSSASDAAEKARKLGVEILNRHLQEPLPSTLMARIDNDEYVAFVMRPFEKPFQLTGDDPETLYVDSAGHTTAS